MVTEHKPLTIKEWAEDDRPREKMLSKGSGALSDAELMAILIGSGTQKETAVHVAQRILSLANNSLHELGRFTLKDFTRIKGIGPAKGITIMAALELGRRRKRSEALNRKQILSSSDVVEIFQPQLADLPHEEGWIILLNRANRIIETIRISQGGITGTVIDPKVILKHAIGSLASGIVLCHNHPSGNETPSENDIKLTKKIKSMAKELEINLLDHIIVTDQKCYSMADNNLL